MFGIPTETRLRGVPKFWVALDAAFFPEHPMPGPNDNSEIPGLAATVTPEEDPVFPEPDFDDGEQPEQEVAPAPARPPRAERPRPTPPPANPEIGKIVNITCRAARPCGGRVAKIVNVFKLGDFGGTARRYKCQNCKQPFTITV